jgi:DNA polymerase I
MKRDVYKRFSYRRNQSTDDTLIQIINKKFSYSKGRKLYQAYWLDLTEEEQDIIRKANPNLLQVKIARKKVASGQWQKISIPLTNEFFQLLGWYIAEGHGQQNRFAITQSIEKKSDNVREILRILKKLNWPCAFYGDGTIVIHSNVLSAVIGTLCGTHAHNKRIPIFLLNKQRARTLLETYFKGDGNYDLNGNRRYTTVSSQLISDLTFLFSAIGKFTSLHRDSGETRIVETLGRQYSRKYRGLINFNGTNLVRVKSIITEPEVQTVYDIETGNGWFVTTQGIVTHNSYGVLGASHFPLYCAPAAESITALGRFAITETIKKAEEIGVSVLYGDTDSLFLDNPNEDQLRQLIEYSEKELRVELDVEKEYRYVALSSRKKNYLGVSKDGQVDIKGLTGKKRNTPMFLQEAFMQMIDILRQVRDPDGFEVAKDQIFKLAREKLTMLERREFAVEDLAIRVQLTKNLEAYTKTTPQHVKAAKLLKKAGQEVKAGDIIAFVKTTGNNVKPVEQATVQDIDTAKYKDLVKSTFEQVLDALGIEWFDTIGMRTLDTFFG